MTGIPSETYLPGVETFEFAPDAVDAAARILAQEPAAIFHDLLGDQESEAALLACKQILDAFITEPAGQDDGGDAAGGCYLEDLSTQVEEQRIRLAALLEAELREGSAAARRTMLRERAVLGLIAGCWLDNISQPATQPGTIVNLLYQQYFRRQGEGVVANSAPRLHRRLLEQAGICLPDVSDITFGTESGSTGLTFLHACFYLALSRYAANYLPEVIGVNYVYCTIDLDSVVAGQPPAAATEAAEAVRRYMASLGDGPAERRLKSRLTGAIVLCLGLETRQAELLAAKAKEGRLQSLDARFAAIVARHAPFAGKQHGNVRVSGQKLTEIFAAPDLDALAFVQAFKRSPYAKGMPDGQHRFLRAVKFGGPMFGIFDAEETSTIREWLDSVGTDVTGSEAPPAPAAAHADAAKILARIRNARPRGVVLRPASDSLDDREFFFRLVNIENFPNLLPLARQRAANGLRRAEALFRTGQFGKYTDTSFFEYSPQALLERLHAIYWRKLVEPHAPLETMPSKDEVVFLQKTFALGNLIDGSWLFRIGKTGRYDRISDGMMFAIYADEMGRGELRKNHIALIYKVLESMSVRLPHIGDPAFLEQDELLDDFYDFAIHQLCLALFPDSFHPEIIGYNLAIEMFGLGELRLHEIQKLRHWGFDASYEITHLSIDNVASGHSQLSTKIVMSYLDQVRRYFGEVAMHGAWRRIWAGYASFAHYVEGARGADLASDASLVI